MRHDMPLIECVPNFSEGRDPAVISEIESAIRSVEGVRLLDVDPGKGANRTVMTFVGSPDAVLEAAVRSARVAAERIDMRDHQGEHPRIGALDVCPLIPISGVSMEETVEYARELGRRIGEEVGTTVYLYEQAASRPERRNLAHVRSGEYEGLEAKLEDPDWTPDYGPASFNAQRGVTVVGARDFLVAYNINLNTTSTRRAFAVAFDLREQGRLKRLGNPLTGEIAVDEDGEQIWIPGCLKSVKAIGWYIPEYGVAQVSMNLTNLADTALHEAFEAACEKASARGLRVTGSELVGLIPRSAMLDAGKHFLRKQNRSLGIPDAEIIKIAVRSMGLDELSPFDPKTKIIEYMLEDEAAEDAELISLSAESLSAETASESPAPGGGSIAAYVGALGASLGTMVANLSAHKRGWDDRWEEFSNYAERGESLRVQLLGAVDADTHAFDAVLEAYRLPKDTEEAARLRAKRIEEAMIQAIEVPLGVMKVSADCFPLLREMAASGLGSAVSDAGVGALCALTAVRGAHLNVLTNLNSLKNEDRKAELRANADAIVVKAKKDEAEILSIVEQRLADAS